MVSRAKPPRKKKTPPSADTPAIEGAAPDIVERPDGYYWQASDGRQEFGPFESFELAQSDRDAVGDEALAPVETLLEAEHEIGIADWIDAETG
ncbi:MAG TPA: hypothetical protein VF319_02920, partial [Caldimonas sp.]